MVGEHTHAFACLDHRHLCTAPEQFRQHAFMCGIHVCDEDKTQSAIGRQVGKKLLKRFERSSGAPHPDDMRRPPGL